MLLSPNSSLYHGSAERFKHIDVAKGRGFKDFGKGFYMSVDRLVRNLVVVDWKECI